MTYEKSSQPKPALTSAHHLDIRVLNALSLGGVGLVLVLANRVAKSWEAVSRMEHCQHANSQDNHDTLKNNEFRLIAHELTPPATSQLRNAVDASHEDAKVCCNNSAHEATEAGLAKQCHRLLGQLIAVVVCAQSIFAKEASKDSEDKDLKDDTSNHQICADVLHFGATVRSRCDTTTCALENEREDIASDEDASVPHGSKTRPSFTEADDDMLEREIDAGGDESGRNNEAADLDDEAAVVDRVVVEHETAAVSYRLANASET